MIDNTHASGPASGYVPPQPKGTEGVSALTMAQEKAYKPQIDKAFKEWCDSDACKEMQKANEEARQRAIGKYHMLSEEDKIDMVEAITSIMCKSEKEGTSHRGLQSALGIYPAGFWVDHLMEIHNSLWSYYHDQKVEKELKDDLDALEKFTENKRDC
jgi:hypothetical protein